MSALCTGNHLESSAGLPLHHSISHRSLFRLPHLPGITREFSCRRRSRPPCSSVTLQPSHRLTVAFPSMADSQSSDTERNSVDRAYTEIVVIRHGQTEWNKDGRIQGHLDVELNDFGRQEAVAVAERLSRESKISAIYSSDLKRAFETASIIGSSCGKIEVIQDPNLRERHLGDLQGIVYHEAPKSKTKAYQALQSRRTDIEIPGGGESLDQLYRRCTSSLQMIGNKHRGERVVVVTHGGVIRALHRRASLQGGRGAGKIHNTSVNVFHLSDPDQWTIKVWGDVSHLDRTGFLESGFGGDKTSG